MKRLKQIINTILENRGKEKLSSISEESNLRNDLGLDSLDLAELTVHIEVEHDVDIFENGVVSTVGEMLEKIKN